VCTERALPYELEGIIDSGEHRCPVRSIAKIDEGDHKREGDGSKTNPTGRMKMGDGMVEAF
jgi:hypothetical protein